MKREKIVEAGEHYLSLIYDEIEEDIERLKSKDEVFNGSEVDLEELESMIGMNDEIQSYFEAMIRQILITLEDDINAMREEYLTRVKEDKEAMEYLEWEWRHSR